MGATGALSGCQKIGKAMTDPADIAPRFGSADLRFEHLCVSRRDGSDYQRASKRPGPVGDCCAGGFRPRFDPIQYAELTRLVEKSPTRAGLKTVIEAAAKRWGVECESKDVGL